MKIEKLVRFGIKYHDIFEIENIMMYYTLPMYQRLADKGSKRGFKKLIYFLEIKKEIETQKKVRGFYPYLEVCD